MLPFKLLLKRLSYFRPAYGMLVAVFMLTNCINVFAQGKLNVVKVRNADELHQYFKFTGHDVPLISGHRGGTTAGYPENCIATFEHTLRYTPAFFEIDPRLTKDSVIVLMHDATLDRTTTGTGKIIDYTWEELKKVRLKDAQGNPTPFGITRLDEAIRWSRGKTILNLDKKDVPMAMTAKILRDLKADDHVMLTVHNATDARFYYDQNPNSMFSAFVLSKAELEEYEKAGIPWSHVMAYVGPRSKPESKELYDLLHARGVMCMISAAPTYDKLTDSSARASAYQEIITGGADVIESDLPIEAAAAIKNLVPHKSEKQRFFARSIL